MTINEKCVICWTDFYSDVNTKKGIDREKLNRLEESLISLRKEYSHKGYIPIEVGNVFIDLYSSLESLSYLYSENEQKEILYVADYLANLARDVCSNN